MKVPNPMNLYRFVKAMWYFRHKIDHSGSFNIDKNKVLKTNGNFDYVVLYRTFEDLPADYQKEIKKRAKTYKIVFESVEE